MYYNDLYMWVIPRYYHPWNSFLLSVALYKLWPVLVSSGDAKLKLKLWLAPGNKKRANNSYGRPGLETNDIAVYFESLTTSRARRHVFVTRRHSVALTADYASAYRQDVIAEREVDFISVKKWILHVIL